MEKFLTLTVTLVFILGLGIVGCGQKQAANSQAAIEQSKTMKTADEQAKFLVNQANSFISSKQFDQAVETARYVLSKLDANSQEAKATLQRATDEMKKAAQGAMNDMKKKIGGIGQ